ncbi:sugar diacid recognition domain-containing protein [Paenibacillus cisolokensis]|uniref:CdaR family transcriptional regulator n=1 Tax=Paenibacillus cisolokensis TaxID=1658519 RepID=UPI003D2846F3
MQFLTRELAQEIVERTMSILNRNINVMNESGVIIGSGDPERIGQLHDGALLVLRTGERVEIDQLRAAELKSSRPGINLPISFNGQTVGVVGITGEPADIRNYAELVRMAAELVLEQSFLLENVQWKQRIQNDIVNQLISEENVDEESVIERARAVGIALRQPRMVIVLDGPDSTEAAVQKRVRAVQYEVGRSDLIGVTFNHEIVILKSVPEAPQAQNTELTLFLKRLLQVAGGSVLIGCGSLAERPKGLQASFNQARSAIQVGGRLRAGARVYRYEDYRLEIMLSRLAWEEQDQQAFAFYEQLLGHEKKGELAHTLEVFIEEGGELHSIAERLFIHRNTLRYRLDKITELTGRDPRNLKGLMELYMARLWHHLR